MARKYFELVLAPAVQQAQDKYFGKHQAVVNALGSDALTLDEADFISRLKLLGHAGVLDAREHQRSFDESRSSRQTTQESDYH